MVRVTSQGIQNRRSQQGSQDQDRQQNRNRNAGLQDTGAHGKNHTHQGTDSMSGHPLNTPAYQLQVFGWLAGFESLIAESTRWPAPGTAAHKAGESHHYWQVHS
ncbi:unnamed protein product [Staurois parvus]|uniref:Uncharacterized protein n=1 Tax=Staurois parvus TaxID=386267 RepID=A0ABN9CE05_9NEOB|nr:unnamed protein product [Staurois parvus]